MKKILLLLFITISFQSIAQKNKGCNFYGDNAKFTQKDICDYLNNFNNSGDAEEIIDDILAQIGLKRNFVIMECPNYENASAVNIKGKDDVEIRYLIYGSKFLSRLNSKTKDWGAYSILAHEIGHHLNGHTLTKAGSKPPTELEADEFSGFVLNKLGATLEEAQEVFKIGGSEKASSTHPARKDRLFAVEQGWNSANALTSINTVVRVDTVIVNNTIIEEKVVTKTDTLVISKKDTVVIFEKEEVENLKTKLQIGLDFGSINVYGDVASKTIFNGAVKPINTLGWGLSVRKAWGYVISTRLQYMHGSASGYNWQSGTGYWNKPGNHWSKAGYGITPVNYNYKTVINELSLQVVAALNNIKYHNARNKMSYYVFGGLGGMTYNTSVDVKDAANANYNFANVAPGVARTFENRKSINKDLRDKFDGDYETKAETYSNRNELAIGTLRAIGNFGAGLQIRLSKTLSLQIEDKITWTGDDLIDGQKWQEAQYTNTGLPITATMTGDMDKINYLSVGIIFSINKKLVPLN